MTVKAGPPISLSVRTTLGRAMNADPDDRIVRLRIEDATSRRLIGEVSWSVQEFGDLVSGNGIVDGSLALWTAGMPQWGMDRQTRSVTILGDWSYGASMEAIREAGALQFHGDVEAGWRLVLDARFNGHRLGDGGYHAHLERFVSPPGEPVEEAS